MIFYQVVSLEIYYTSKDFKKKRGPKGYWKMGGFKHHKEYWWTPVLSKHLS